LLLLCNWFVLITELFMCVNRLTVCCVLYTKYTLKKNCIHMWLDLIKPSFNAQSFVRRYGDFKYLFCGSFTLPKAVQTKFAPIIHLSISNHGVGVQVSDTQILPCFGKVFLWVIISQVVVVGVVGRLNIAVLNGGVRWVESRDQVKALCGPSQHSNHSKLSDITVCEVPVHCTQFQQGHGLYMVPIIH